MCRLSSYETLPTSSEAINCLCQSSKGVVKEIAGDLRDLKLRELLGGISRELKGTPGESKGISIQGNSTHAAVKLRGFT